MYSYGYSSCYTNNYSYSYDYSHYNNNFYSYNDYCTSYTTPSYSNCYDHWSDNTCYYYQGDTCNYFDYFHSCFDYYSCFDYLSILIDCYVPCLPVCDTPNIAPEAQNDNVTDVARGSSNALTAVTVAVLTNDFDSDGELDSTSVKIEGAQGNGKELVVEGEGIWTVDTTTGDITFTPNSDFFGNPTAISYTVADNDGKSSNQAQVTVSYEQANEAPVAEDDVQSGQRNIDNSLVAVTLDVTANDSDVDGDIDLTTVTLVGSADGKSLEIDGEGSWTVDASTGEITFTAFDGFISNPASIEYTVKDDNGMMSNTATVTINYPDAILNPIAANDYAEGEVSTIFDIDYNLLISTAKPVTISVTDNDIDNDGEIVVSTVSIVGADADGRLVVADEGTWTVDSTTGNITFTPTESFDGEVTPIAYTVNDNDGLASNVATVSIVYPEAYKLTANNQAKSVAVDLDANDFIADENATLFAALFDKSDEANMITSVNTADVSADFYVMPQTNVNEVII